MSRPGSLERVVAVVGSRSFGNEQMVRDFAREMTESADVIVTGGAPGVDSWVEDEVRNRKALIVSRLEVIRPDYEKYGRYLAPKHRNWEIAKRCNELHAFWNGFSGGTAHVVACAVALGKRVTVHRLRLTVATLQEVADPVPAPGRSRRSHR